MEQVILKNVTATSPASLAPMASVADTAYRLMCKKYTAAILTSELISAKAVSYNDKKSFELCNIMDTERPFGIQLFGSEADIMAVAAKKVYEYSKPDFIDINMGCPVPKVVKSGAGSALMRNIKNASDIVSAVADAVTVPVTVKFRKGWDSTSVNAVEFAKAMENAGADLIAIHGRTRQQMYAPPVDIDIIKAVKEAVSIPVIGNGGIYSVYDAEEMYKKTNCDLVMIGQGSFGRPWIFEDITNYLLHNKAPIERSVEEKIEIMLEHISLIISLKGEENGMREARKHAAWYIKGLRGAAKFRRDCGQLSTYEDLKILSQKILNDCQF